MVQITKKDCVKLHQKGFGFLAPKTFFGVNLQTSFFKATYIVYIYKMA